MDDTTLCECGDPTYDDSPFPFLCYECADEAAREEYEDRLVSRYADPMLSTLRTTYRRYV